MTSSKQKSRKLQIPLTKEFLTDLEILLKLNSNQLSELAKVVNTDKGFYVPDISEIDNLARGFGISGDEIYSVLNVVRFLFNEVDELGASDSELFGYLMRTASENNFASPKGKRASIARLFSISPKFRFGLKVKPFKHGLLQRLTAVAYTHEIRAVFEKEGKTDKIIGFVPIVTIRLVVEDEKEKRNTLVFTASESSLNRLADYIKSAQRNLATMVKTLKKRKPSLIDQE